MLVQVLDAPGTFRAVDEPIPVPQAGEVILEMAAVTVCGSDLRIVSGEKTGSVVWPVVIGHEFTGRVYAVGAAVDEKYKVGDLYGVVPWVTCGVCRYCLSGVSNLCHERRVFGYKISGGLSEYVRIPEAAVRNGNLVALPGGFDPAVAALAEPLACVYNGHIRSSIRVGDTVLVLGGGPIGMFHTKLAKLAGAEQIVVSEPNQKRAQTMRRLGADHVVNPREIDLVETIMGLTNGDGSDVSIVCIGIPELVNTAASATRRGGVLNLFAGFAGAGAGEFDFNTVHYRQQTVLGNAGSTIPYYRKAVELITSGSVAADDMVTKRFPLSQAQQALDTARTGGETKVAILPDKAFA